MSYLIDTMRMRFMGLNNVAGRRYRAVVTRSVIPFLILHCIRVIGIAESLNNAMPFYRAESDKIANREGLFVSSGASRGA